MLTHRHLSFCPSSPSYKRNNNDDDDGGGGGGGGLASSPAKADGGSNGGGADAGGRAFTLQDAQELQRVLGELSEGLPPNPEAAAATPTGNPEEATVV